MSQLAATLQDTLGAQAVYLHGSFAHGGVHEGSDIDLVVVADLPVRMVDRIALVLAQTDLPVEPLVYTPEEFKREIRVHNPFIEQILAQGRRLV